MRRRPNWPWKASKAPAIAVAQCGHLPSGVTSQGVAEVVPHWLTGIDSKVALKAISHIPFDPRMSPLVKEGWSHHAKLLQLPVCVHGAGLPGREARLQDMARI